MAGNLQEGTNVSGTWCGSKRPIALIGLWYVTSFAVSPAAWGSGSPGFEAIPVDASEAPLVVHVDDWEPPVATTDAVVLALRILQGREKGLRVGASEWRELAHEIERILSRIRNDYPVIEEVTIWQSFDPWALILHLDPDLYRKVSRAVSLLEGDGDAGGSVALLTGHVNFDTLNSEHGLAAVELLPSFSSAIFYFDHPVHPFMSVPRYSLVEGVESVRLDGRAGDGPDIAASSWV